MRFEWLAHGSLVRVVVWASLIPGYFFLYSRISQSEFFLMRCFTWRWGLIVGLISLGIGAFSREINTPLLGSKAIQTINSSVGTFLSVFGE